MTAQPQSERQVRRFILTVRESARVRYEVLATDEAEARALYERGDVTYMLVDEHDGGDITEVEDVTGQGLHRAT